VNKTLIILFSINIFTSQPAFEKFYYGDVDYDSYNNIKNILSISDAIDNELSYNFMYDYNNDDAVDVNGTYSITAIIFGLGL
tara:strand:+ start:170 stop:415 length:246 start_codon:yes stop_codon:yes gene_type:complete